MTTSPPDNAHVTALVALISSAVQDIIQTYTAAGHTVPTLASTTPGPFDTPAATPHSLTRAIQIVEGACAQLCATVARPGQHLLARAMGYEECACLGVAAEARISDFLRDAPAGLHVRELAARSGLPADKLARIMRLLATKHVYTEVAPDVFANNRLSMLLLSTDPFASIAGVAADETMKAAAYLVETLEDPEFAHSNAADKCAFTKASGGQTKFFGYFANDPRGKTKAKRFSTAMVAISSVTDKGMLPRVYPWADAPRDAVVCDIGGSNGHVMLDLVRAHPHLQVVVQDLGTVQPMWNELWTKDGAETVQQGRARFLPIDFFKDIPVKGCDYYYIRQIIHDWPDAESVKILQNVAASMKPSSRLLIHDYVLQSTSRPAGSDTGTAGEAQDIAPAPLLPNYGAGRIGQYLMDMNMMCSLNAKERTLQEFIELGKQAGLTFVRLWDAGERGVVEFKL